MKKLSFLALAAVGLLLGACSSDKDVVTDATSTISADGDGFLGISIQLPSADAPATRANDDLVNGAEEEFEVKNAYLYLFKGSSEAGATFLRRYTISDEFNADNKGKKDEPEAQEGVTLPGGTAITSTSIAVCKVQNVTLATGENLYAFVVVNAQGALAAEPAVGTPFSTFSVKELVASDHGGTLEGEISDDYGLLMTSSPISDKGAGSDEPSEENLTTLVKLANNAIKTTREAALAAPAGCVYVERAAAKVTVSDNITGDKEIEMGSSSTLSYEILGWQVINTEPKFYNTRQLEKTWDPLFSDFWTGKNTTWRFISKYNFAPTLGVEPHTTGYRTYFAKDLQYDKTASLEKTVAINDDDHWLPLTGRSYVTENTFDVAHQTRHNTTQVTLCVEFNGGDDFYTISDDANYYLPTTVENTIASKVEALYNVNKFKEDLIAYELTELKNANNTKYYKASVKINAEITDKTAAADDAAYTVSYTLTTQSSDTENGTYTDCEPIALSTTLSNAWTTAKGEAEDALTISLYKGGLSYYNIRIQHFGEYETPWNTIAESEAQADTKSPFKIHPGENVDQIYGYRSGKETIATSRFLGRYGVVRDNWYNLSIDAIAKLGSAEPKPVNGDETPDDEIEREFYISAHVHILPWVLRTQHVSF